LQETRYVNENDLLIRNCKSQFNFDLIPDNIKLDLLSLNIVKIAKYTIFVYQYYNGIM